MAKYYFHSYCLYVWYHISCHQLLTQSTKLLKIHTLTPMRVRLGLKAQLQVEQICLQETIVIKCFFYLPPLVWCWTYSRNCNDYDTTGRSADMVKKSPATCCRKGAKSTMRQNYKDCYSWYVAMHGKKRRRNNYF